MLNTKVGIKSKQTMKNGPPRCRCNDGKSVSIGGVDTWCNCSCHTGDSRLTQTCRV